MTPTRPLADFWYPIARILLTLRALLRATSPDGFAAISAHVCRELRLSGAAVRRYLLALARELTLPPPRGARAAGPERAQSEPRSRKPVRAFRLDEPVSPKRAGSDPFAPPGDIAIEWALAFQKVETLLAAMRDPLPLARRLARRLARQDVPRLRELVVPAHILRAIPPALDVFLMRLDALARPDAWAGIDIDTG